MKISFALMGVVGAIFLLIYLFGHGGMRVFMPPEDQLFEAVNEKDVQRVKQILKAGAIKNIDKGFGGSNTSALIRAVEKNDIEIASALITAGANVNYEAAGRETALHVAAFYGYTKLVNLLIQNGANPNIPLDQNGFTPLHEAIRKGHVDVAKYLVASGANVSDMTKDGRTAIMMARRLGYEELAHWLEQAKH